MQIEFNKVTWYSKWGAVILFLIVLPILTFYIGREYQKTVYVVENNSTYVAEKTLETKEPVTDPLNAMYVVDGEEVILVNGVAGSSGTETRIFGEPTKGDINNDGKIDHVFFLSQETSGTGIFFYVVASVNEKGTNAVFVGDRIAPQNINIANGVVAVNYATRRENEPMTASPSLGVTKYLVYKNGELIERVEQKDVFDSSSKSNNQSTVVGYIAGGAFVFNNLPAWIVENWKTTNKEGDVITFTPREEISDRDFSDIVMEIATTTEQFNADYLYNSYSKSQGMNAGKLLIAEIFFNSAGDTRVHHVQRLFGTGIEDTFYIDGNGKTVMITFKASPDNYVRYGAKIKEFVQGIGKGGIPQG